jgi:hypothetical protein
VEPTRQEFLHITHPEQILFYVLVYCSLAYMAWQIAARVRLWLQGRPTGELRAGWRYWLPTKNRLTAWLKNIGEYVLLQKKVRSSRPKSGAPMHLLIFYGFVSLVIATTLLAINTYGPVKFHHGTYYLVYEGTFDFLGLFLIIGVAWAPRTRSQVGTRPSRPRWRIKRRRTETGRAKAALADQPIC